MKNSKKISIFIGEKEEKKLSEKKLKKKMGAKFVHAYCVSESQ